MWPPEGINDLQYLEREIERIFDEAIRSTPNGQLCHLEDIDIRHRFDVPLTEIMFRFSGDRGSILFVDPSLASQIVWSSDIFRQHWSRLFYEIFENERIDVRRRQAQARLAAIASEYGLNSSEWRTAFEEYRNLDSHFRAYHSRDNRPRLGVAAPPPRLDQQYMGMPVIVDELRDFGSAFDLRHVQEAQEQLSRTELVDVCFSGNRSLGSCKEAREKALKLLKENLTPQQLQTYEKHKWFEVKGGDTGRTYRIHHGRQMNISVRNWRGKHKHGLCFLPTGGLVEGDIMLGQKIALELYESEALKVANRFDHDPGYTFIF